MGMVEEVIRQKARQILLSLVGSIEILRLTNHSGRSGNGEPESMLYIF